MADARGAQMITGHTRLLAVIGSPVSHSLSPVIHNIFARSLELPYAYMAFDVTPSTLGAFMDAARTLKIAGFNVTMPLKNLISPYLAEAPGSGAAGGSVNTVALREDGGMYGISTDGDGFAASLDAIGFDFGSGHAAVLGAGGAAAAVSAVLRARGMPVRAAARRPEAFPELPGVTVVPWGRLREAARGAAILVNATPLGMRGAATGAQFESFDFLDGLPRGATVYDLIYEPPQTRLLEEAAARGLAAVNG
ncbi:MAG: hypothetical protein LBJ99_00870, partial [Oscillospiraceae bacterium]|nr:hypothetical protein [Oscillospiraceae bacterium]